MERLEANLLNPALELSLGMFGVVGRYPASELAGHGFAQGGHGSVVLEHDLPDPVSRRGAEALRREETNAQSRKSSAFIEPRSSSAILQRVLPICFCISAAPAIPAPTEPRIPARGNAPGV